MPDYWKVSSFETWGEFGVSVGCFLSADFDMVNYESV